MLPLPLSTTFMHATAVRVTQQPPGRPREAFGHGVSVFCRHGLNPESCEGCTQLDWTFLVNWLERASFNCRLGMP